MNAKLILLFSFIPYLQASIIFFRGKSYHPLKIKVNQKSNLWTSKTSLFDEIEENYFQQTLNHFDPSDNRTWKQRYFVNDKFFESNGPVFLQLGGEGIASPEIIKKGQIATNYAVKFNAYLIEIEHRFYGKSHPTDDLSTENLKYLTSEQALADIATFIQEYKKRKPLLGSQWILFGGSYSGSLAAWFTIKYPHLVSGAVASSAPMLALTEFDDYVSVVEKSLGLKCSKHFTLATKKIEYLMKSEEGIKQLEKYLWLCDPLDIYNRDDIYNLMSTIANYIFNVVQYNGDNRFSTFETNMTIDRMCNIMGNTEINEEIERYSQLLKILLNGAKEKCLDYKYSKYITQLSEVDWKSMASQGGRQWTYQTCVEFGFFQSSKKSKAFGNYFPIEFFIKQCKDIFGTNFNEDLLIKGIIATNTKYGGYNAKTKKVIFPNGLIDPWHALGLTNSRSFENPSLLINGTAHCADIYPSSESDTIGLKIARKAIENHIEKTLYGECATPI